MYGGQIIGNTSVALGGGVQVGGDSVFRMSGGTISGNVANVDGGVSVSSLFNMSGGTVTNNKAASLGGGVRILASGEFNMIDAARVFSNIASEYFHGSFTPVPYTSTDGVEPFRLATLCTTSFVKQTYAYTRACNIRTRYLRDRFS